MADEPALPRRANGLEKEAPVLGADGLPPSDVAQAEIDAANNLSDATTRIGRSRRASRSGGRSKPGQSEISDLLSISSVDSASSATRTVVDGLVSRHGRPDRLAQERRIASFVLFRLGLLLALTALGAFASWFSVAEGEPSNATLRETLLWSALAAGYASSGFFAWRLPRAPDVERLARVLTATDVVLAATVVQVTGGVDSGFLFLYLVAILGAALMAARGQVVTATISCVALFCLMASFQGLSWIVPLDLTGSRVEMKLSELLFVSARTSAAMIGVGVLSFYLTSLVARASSQVGDLQALNEHIVRSLSSGLLTVDLTGNVIFANPTALNLLGLQTVSEGSEVAQLLPQLPAHVLGGVEDTRRNEIAHRTVDGRSLQLGISSSPLRDGQGRLLGQILDLQDLTHLRLLSAQLQRSERLAAIGGLAATVAHEIRNPLAAISGCAELLSMGPRDEEDARLLAVIRRESTRLNQTVGDLLSFARARAPSLRPLNVVDVCRDVVEGVAQDPANKGLVIRLQKATDSYAVADADQLAQVLWNLLRNAAEATQHAGCIELSVSSQGPWVELTVSDDGPGLAQEQLDRLFEPSYSTTARGTGFGLAVVHSIVEDHHGQIDAQCPPTGGTVFTIKIPKADQNVGRRP